jgi:hypothetical protein
MHHQPVPHKNKPKPSVATTIVKKGTAAQGVENHRQHSLSEIELQIGHDDDID